MEGTPRRALDPLPDDLDDPEDDQATAARLPAGDDSALTDTGMMRRLAFAPDASSPGTAVPPPRPVLPVWEPLPASAGRRFSADDAPYDNDWAAPRRSAASVSSPMSEYEPLLPPVSRPIAPPAVTVPYQPLSRAATPSAAAPGPVPSMALPTSPAELQQPTEPTPASSRKDDRAARAAAKQDARTAARAEAQAKADARVQAKATAAQAKVDAKAAAPVAEAPRADADAASTAGRHADQQPPSRGRRTIIIVVAIVLVLALIGAGIFWAVSARGGSAVTNPAASAVDPLLTVADATALGDGAWQEVGVTKTPLCVGQDTAPAAQRTASRMLSSDSADVLQLTYTFADDASAGQAYSAALTAAGTCSGDTALVVGASTVSGLADSADAVQLTVQGAKDAHHVLLLTRSGRTMNTFDVTGDASLTVARVVEVAAKALARQCSSGSTCPSGVSVAGSLPAAGDPAGWLVAADLPQITPGSGKWSALPIQAIALEGSQCEDMDLGTVTGTTTSAERVFVLTGDSKAPAHFGLDHAVWTFSTAKAASALADKLSTNISGCAKTTPTATVKDGSSVKGTGTGTTQVTGKTWEITHKLSTGTIVFRVAVVTSGTRVSYLLANPSTSFDFSDAEWGAVALRAGQRASQAS